jgi:hypothetical protein
MKIILDPSQYTFVPGSPGTGRIDFTTFTTYQAGRCLAVINNDSNGGTLIYSVSGGASVGAFSALTGTDIFFAYNTSGMNASDSLTVIYDDPAAVQEINGSVSAVIAGNVRVENDSSAISATAITSPVLNALNNTAFAVDASPFSVMYVQVKFTGSASFVIEGSNDNTTFVTITARKLNDAGDPILGAWGPVTNDIVAVPIECKYVRLRATTVTGSLDVFTYFSQIPYTDIIQHNALIAPNGRSINYGAGQSSAQTIRVIPSSDSTIAVGDLIVSSPSSYSAINTNILNGVVGTTNNGLDVTNYRSVGLTVTGSAGISAGQVTCEISNDNINWTSFVLIPPANSTPTPISGAFSVGANSNTYLQASLPFRFFRVRISQAFTGGTVTAVARLSPNHHSGMAIPVIGTVTAAISGTPSVNASIGTTGVVSLVGADNNDIGSTTITSSQTSSTVSNSNNTFYAFGQYVTAISGSGAAVDTVIQASMNGGTNWYDAYHFPRMTATGQFYTGPIKIVGNSIRYVRTVSGTTPSITMSLRKVLRVGGDAPIATCFYDRTIAVNTLNAATPSYFVDGCDSFSMTVSMGAITTTAPQFQLEGSDDDANWFALGTPLTSVASSTVNTFIDGAGLPRFIRARVSTAGSGATLVYVNLKGNNL